MAPKRKRGLRTLRLRRESETVLVVIGTHLLNGLSGDAVAQGWPPDSRFWYDDLLTQPAHSWEYVRAWSTMSYMTQSLLIFHSSLISMEPP
jgi:hypothetical protein